jgi:hypothetical protein
MPLLMEANKKKSVIVTLPLNQLEEEQVHLLLRSIQTEASESCSDDVNVKKTP